MAARAARAGKSLQEYLRGELIEFTSKPDIESLLGRVAARKEATGSSLSAEKILAALGDDRR